MRFLIVYDKMEGNPMPYYTDDVFAALNELRNEKITVFGVDVDGISYFDKFRAMIALKNVIRKEHDDAYDPAANIVYAVHASLTGHDYYTSQPISYHSTVRGAVAKLYELRAQYQEDWKKVDNEIMPHYAMRFNDIPNEIYIVQVHE